MRNKAAEITGLVLGGVMELEEKICRKANCQ